MKAIFAPPQHAERKIDLGRGEEFHECAARFLAAGSADVPRADGTLAHGGFMTSAGSSDDARNRAVHADAQAGLFPRAVLDGGGPLRVPVGRAKGRLLQREA